MNKIKLYVDQMALSMQSASIFWLHNIACCNQALQIIQPFVFRIIYFSSKNKIIINK